MKSFWILLLCLVSIYAQNPIPSGELSPCTFCQFAAQQIENLISASANKEDVLSVLNDVKTNFCPLAATTGYLKKEECEEYVDEYGPYALDMFLSDEIISPTSLCVDLGVCADSNSQATNAQILFPQFQERFVEFTKMVENPYQNSKYSYKVFVAKPSFEYKKLKMKVEVEVEDCEVELHVENKDLTVQENAMCENDCRVKVFNVVPGTWFYITVTPTVEERSTTRDSAKFTLKIRERSADHKGHHWKGHGLKKKCTLWIAGAVFAGIIGCCCCCCCIRRCMRRKCSRYGQGQSNCCQKKPQPQQQPQIQVVESGQDIPMVQLDSMENETVDAMPIPVMVYYPTQMPFGQQISYVPMEQAPQ